MFRTIVAETDGGNGRGAVTLAAALAQLTGDRLVVAAVRPDPLVEVPALQVVATTRAARRQERELRALRDELAPGASVWVQPAPSLTLGLLAAAAHHRAGLVVVGNSRGRGHHQTLESNRTLQLLHRAAMAVLLVPEDDHAVPPHDVRRIVAGFDGGTGGAAATELAADLALRTGASLEIVRVVDDRPPGTIVAARDVPLGWETAVAEEADAAREAVTLAAVSCAVPAAVGVVAVGRPAQRLAEAADGADVLVLGSRCGRGRGMAPGSTPAEVLARSPCAVLLAQPPARTAPAGAPAAGTRAAGPLRGG